MLLSSASGSLSRHSSGVLRATLSGAAGRTLTGSGVLASSSSSGSLGLTLDHIQQAPAAYTPPPHATAASATPFSPSPLASQGPSSSSSQARPAKSSRPLLNALSSLSALAHAKPFSLRNRHVPAESRPFKISTHSSLLTLDLKRLSSLLEASFGKELDANYLSKLSTLPFKIYLAGDYQGCAILTYDSGIAYLCKFAVSPDCQGQGIAAKMWKRMEEDNSDMFWRSRNENPVNSWYETKSMGSHRSDKWTVFWFGQRANELEDTYRSYCVHLPPTFKLAS